MSCIELGHVPDPPGLAALLPPLDIPIPDPHLGISLCCELSAPPFPIPPVPLYLIPGVVTIMVTASPLIMDAIDEINTLLDSIQVDCPLD